jgi:DtxR family Mn-dependent transcriptional regulator
VDDGVAGVVVSVSDHDPALLRFLAELGLTPGRRVTVVGRAPFGGPIRMRVDDGAPVEVPPKAASAVQID